MYISAAFENQQQKTFKSGAMYNNTFLFELFVRRARLSPNVPNFFFWGGEGLWDIST